jgi:hypothetical protein
MKKLIIPLLFFLILLVPVVSAFSITGTGNYKMQGVISGGGDFIASTGYESMGVIGQPIIGTVTGPTFEACLGIFCTGFLEPMNRLEITGQARYANESKTPVALKNVLLNVSFTGYQFKATNKTDNLGYFTLNINMPATIKNEEFLVEVYAFGEIDAVYRCQYDPTTQICSK